MSNMISLTWCTIIEKLWEEYEYFNFKKLPYEQISLKLCLKSRR